MKKTCRKLFGIFLGLVMVLGLMPGMGVKVYADPIAPEVEVTPSEAGAVNAYLNPSSVWVFTPESSDGYKFIKWTYIFLGFFQNTEFFSHFVLL